MVNAVSSFLPIIYVCSQVLGSTEKLTTFIDDIFEAEDSVPAEPPDDIEESELQGYFSKLTEDWSQPILNTRIVARLTKIVDGITKPAKRARRDALLHSPGQGQQEGLPGVEVHILSRILKILERAVVRAEDSDPFAGPITKLKGASTGATMGNESGKSPAKGKKARKGKSPEGRRSKSRTPVDGDGGNGHNIEMDEGDEEVDWHKVEKDLNISREAILSTDACVAILSADRLPKQVRLSAGLPCESSRKLKSSLLLKLYSEEMITSCLNVVKNMLTKIIYPFLECSSEIQGKYSIMNIFIKPN
jgi:cohesin loading factor subunit SCC2